MFELSKLKKKNRNPRKINSAQLEKLKNSLSEFPKMLPLRPIVYDPITFEILGGNQRFEALVQLGFKSVPNEWVKSCEGMTEDEKKRFVVADNVAFGDWDLGTLKEDFDKDLLNEWGFDTSLIVEDIDMNVFFEEKEDEQKKDEFCIKLIYSEDEYNHIMQWIKRNKTSIEKFVYSAIITQ